MARQLFIPKTISVGFQERSDTYTGKLAYIIYTDSNGILRKEKSWNSWRDRKIEPQVFHNEPIEGFVLNKKVGGYKSDWNYRQSYIRVYDPRGFEFEITCENLLFILEHCSAIKGKGLEGQFVYSWNGTDLILLPVDCDNYKACSQYTKLQAEKVSKKDLVPGNIYLDKDEAKHLYLGRHTRYRMESKTSDRNNYYSPKIFSFKKSNHHVFVRYDDKKLFLHTDFIFDRDMNSLVSEKCVDFAEAAQNWYESIEGSEPTELTSKEIKYEPTLDSHYRTMSLPNHWSKSENLFVRTNLIDATPTRYDYEQKKYIRNSQESCYTKITYTVSFSDKLEVVHTPYNEGKYKYCLSKTDKGQLNQTKQFIAENQALEVNVKLKSGKTYPINKYLHIW